VARSTDDIVAALNATDAEIFRLGKAARERTLSEHTSDHRASEMLHAIEEARTPLQTPPAREEV
jgi:hypothetical protein